MGDQVSHPDVESAHGAIPQAKDDLTHDGTNINNDEVPPLRTQPTDYVAKTVAINETQAFLLRVCLGRLGLVHLTGLFVALCMLVDTKDKTLTWFNISQPLAVGTALGAYTFLTLCTIDGHKPDSKYGLVKTVGIAYIHAQVFVVGRWSGGEGPEPYSRVAILAYFLAHIGRFAAAAIELARVKIEDPADTCRRATRSARLGMLAGVAVTAVWWKLEGPSQPEQMIDVAIPMGLAVVSLALSAYTTHDFANVVRLGPDKVFKAALMFGNCGKWKSKANRFGTETPIVRSPSAPPSASPPKETPPPPPPAWEAKRRSLVRVHICGMGFCGISIFIGTLFAFFPFPAQPVTLFLVVATRLWARYTVAKGDYPNVGILVAVVSDGLLTPAIRAAVLSVCGPDAILAAYGPDPALITDMADVIAWAPVSVRFMRNACSAVTMRFCSAPSPNGYRPFSEKLSAGIFAGSLIIAWLWTTFLAGFEDDDDNSAPYRTWFVPTPLYAMALSIPALLPPQTEALVKIPANKVVLASLLEGNAAMYVNVFKRMGVAVHADDDGYVNNKMDDWPEPNWGQLAATTNARWLRCVDIIRASRASVMIVSYVLVVRTQFVLAPGDMALVVFACLPMTAIPTAMMLYRRTPTAIVPLVVLLGVTNGVGVGCVDAWYRTQLAVMFKDSEASISDIIRLYRLCVSAAMCTLCSGTLSNVGLRGWSPRHRCAVGAAPLGSFIVYWFTSGVHKRGWEAEQLDPTFHHIFSGYEWALFSVSVIYAITASTLFLNSESLMMFRLPRDEFAFASMWGSGFNGGLDLAQKLGVPVQLEEGVGKIALADDGELSADLGRDGKEVA